MSYQPPTRAPRAIATTDERLTRTAAMHVLVSLHRELAPLSTANKNRVLLELRQLMADELEALETTTTV